MPPPPRTSGNYRSYGPAERCRLSFIRHSRDLGFTIEEIRSLLDLSDHPDRDCRSADLNASRHLAQIEAKIAQLTLLKEELSGVIGRCRGGLSGDCRVIEALGKLERHGNDSPLGSD